MTTKLARRPNINKPTARASLPLAYHHTTGSARRDLISSTNTDSEVSALREEVFQLRHEVRELKRKRSSDDTEEKEEVRSLSVL